MRAGTAAGIPVATTLFLLTAIPLTTSCAHRADRALRPQAAADLQCAESQVRVRRAKLTGIHAQLVSLPHHQEASGCGRTALYIESCPPNVRTGSKECGWVPVQRVRDENLLRRASFTLGCQELAITPLDPITAGVAGCGQRATYVLTCPHDPAFWSVQCTWVMDAVARPQAPAMTPAGPPMPPSTPVPPGPVPPGQPAPPGVALPPSSTDPSLQRM
jgi:hypothetical protein